MPPLPRLYTLGYEGTDIDRFVAALRAAGIRRLAALRAVSRSRKPGFSKTALAARLTAEGIDYRHFLALGAPKPARDAARAGRHQELFTRYAEHLRSEPARAALKDLATAAREQPPCLLCFERDPTTCHRSLVAGELVRSEGFEVEDLYAEAAAPGQR